MVFPNREQIASRLAVGLNPVGQFALAS
eukprot:COSAG02_NODE_42693_length_382_cov_0.727915_1_plen_27_part_01